MRSNTTSPSFHDLKVMCFVFDHGSFSDAANALGQSQSSVSYVIGNLRKNFKDPLFVRHGNSIQSTERCVEIISVVRRMIDEFDSLTLSQPFDPSSVRARIVLSCNYYERTLFFPPFFRKARVDAPGLTFEILPTIANGERQLRRGECDILLSPIEIAGEQLFRRVIMHDRYVCVMDKDNPLSRNQLSLKDYQDAHHAFITYGGRWRPFYLDHLEKHGISIEACVELPSLGNLPSLLGGTDIIATIPAGLVADHSEGLAVRKFPLELELTSYMYWSARTHRSPLFSWIREQISKETMRLQKRERYPAY